MTFEFSGLDDYLKENPMRDLDNIISNGMWGRGMNKKKSFLVILFAMSFYPTTSYNFLWKDVGLANFSMCVSSNFCYPIFERRYIINNPFCVSIAHKSVLMLLNCLNWVIFKSLLRYLKQNSIYISIQYIMKSEW